MSGSDGRPGGGTEGAAETAPEPDELEPLTDEEAERIFLGTALRHAPGMRKAAEACRAALSAAGASEAEIGQALLVLGRDHVFPPSHDG